MIGIIGAMQEEIEAFKASIVDLEEVNILGVTFYKGKLFSKDVVVVKSGIGKVAAASIATLLINNFNVERIMNLGICGGLVNVISEGSVLVVERCVYGDVDVTAFNNKYGQMDGQPLHFICDKEVIDIVKKNNPSVFVGDILTGDQFVTSYPYVKELLTKYDDLNCKGFDMESASIAQVCHTYNIKCNILRWISDVVGKEEQTSTYFENKKESSSKLIDIVNNLLTNL